MLGMLQTILAARNNRQDSPWTQLLVILAIAVVYGIKTLVKAKRSFTEEADENDEYEESSLLLQQRQQEGQRPEPAKPKFTMIQQKRSAPESVKVKTILEDEVEPVKRKSLILQGAEQQGQLQPDIALELDLDDTDSLRKAIIYSEVLGKPVSLRQGD